MIIALLLAVIICYFYFPKYFSAYTKICKILLAGILVTALCMQFPEILVVGGCILFLVVTIIVCKMILWKLYGVDDIVLWEDPPKAKKTPRED